MRKSALMMAMVPVLAVALTGCATSGDLERVQAQERLIGAKADQAMKDAQAAKTAAEEAKLQADTAAARADDAVRMAEERERLAEEREKIAQERELMADEKAEQATAAFQRSMRK